MSEALSGWGVPVFSLFVGVLLIVGALLHRAGVKSVFIPRGFKRLPVGSTILFGAGLALLSITEMIPRGPSTHALVLCLDAAALSLMGASLVALLREKPVIPKSRHR